MPDGTAGYGIGWFTLSLINAGLAQGKRRSGLAWWLVSLLIGPLATLLIVLLPEAAPDTEPRDPIPGLVLVVIAAVLLLALVVGFGLRAS